MWTGPDGKQVRNAVEYDEYGEEIDCRVKRGSVKYSHENGRKVKTEIYDLSQIPKGTAIGFDFRDGLTNSSWILGNNIAFASTFFDEHWRPTGMVFYDAEHIPLSKVVRAYDERGRVKSEEQRMISPRYFTGIEGNRGEEIPAMSACADPSAASLG